MVELWRSSETLASTVESAAAELMESGICATYSRVGAEFGLARFKYTMLLSQEKLDSALRT